MLNAILVLIVHFVVKAWLTIYNEKCNRKNGISCCKSISYSPYNIINTHIFILSYLAFEKKYDIKNLLNLKNKL